MTSTYPTTKYKILLFLSITIAIITLFIYYTNLNDDIEINNKKVEIFLNKYNLSLLEDIFNNYELNLTSNNEPITPSKPSNRLFCFILTTPGNFESKVNIS